MKKVFYTAIGLLLGVLSCCGVFELTEGSVDWQGYIKEQLIPYITIALSSIGTICIAGKPIVNIVVAAVEKFTGATDGVLKTAEHGNEVAEKIDATNADMEAFKEEVSRRIIEMQGAFEASSQLTQKYVGELRDMVKIAFTNTDELVQKGMAAEIAKVGETDGNEN